MHVKFLPDKPEEALWNTIYTEMRGETLWIASTLQQITRHWSCILWLQTNSPSASHLCKPGRYTMKPKNREWDTCTYKCHEWVQETKYQWQSELHNRIMHPLWFDLTQCFNQWLFFVKHVQPACCAQWTTKTVLLLCAGCFHPALGTILR